VSDLGPDPTASGTDVPEITEAPPEPPRRTRSSGPFRRLFSSESSRRVLLLLIAAIASAVLVMNTAPRTTRSLEVGAVAQHDVLATRTFSYVDWAATDARLRAAEQSVPPVYHYDRGHSARIQQNVGEAFTSARRQYGEALLAARAAGLKAPSPDALQAISRDFVQRIELDLDASTLEQLTALGWSTSTEELARTLVALSNDKYVAADRSVLPSPERPLTVIEVDGDDRRESQVDNYSRILDPEDARQAISLRALDLPHAAKDEARVAVAIARAAVRPNFTYDPVLTESKKRAAQDAVEQVVNQVQQGTTLVRKGDVVTQHHADMISGFQQPESQLRGASLFLALAAFNGLVIYALYQFATGYIRKFARRTFELQALVALGILVLGLARAIHELSFLVAPEIGGGIDPSALWYLAPIAGGAMLARILMNSETALVFTVVVSALAGVMMGDHVLYALYFVVAGVTASGSMAHTRERVNVLRAGLQTALISAATAMLLGLVHAGLTAGAEAPRTQALWDMGAAFTGGLASAILVLGLVPLFEVFGFTTDYKLLELANLNHPLLRNLMLRAPGTYHHSVIVGSLSEAAAEAIRCNALLARVCCYFHDIGKAVQPQYYIENQRDAPNRHDRLLPKQSARMIISHVLDGAAIAEQYKLPAPIVDSIRTHHGTGVIQYFYAKALTLAAETGEPVDEADFRYPGPRPSTREQGIIMLADKVEAACRSIKHPTEEKIRGMIQRLVSETITDGQLEECPLTLKELYIVIETFTNVILGIYHQRIEYPGIPKGARPRAVEPDQDVPRSAIITVDIPNPLGLPAGAADGSPAPDSGPEEGPPPRRVDEA
jgi:cyclic-di-AMP phosphodiesterase PgpH